jgi:hypothetical protein
MAAGQGLPNHGSKTSHATWRVLILRRPGPRRGVHLAAAKMNGRRLALSVSCGKWFGTGLAEKQIFHIGSVMKMNGAAALRGSASQDGHQDRHEDGPVAQLDRVADFYSAGCRFESCRDRQNLSLARTAEKYPRFDQGGRMPSELSHAFCGSPSLPLARYTCLAHGELPLSKAPSGERAGPGLPHGRGRSIAPRRP